ncbi:hypothetical protein [Actinomadura fibrosa]|uniref:Uncharacterized protein n=1 Tax=Actinomadura fibrosa TaxID=111802 RepID=A0ABW2XZM5_9ACTN|nr:hypothetical protein [Actinomadura fibrosa]
MRALLQRAARRSLHRFGSPGGSLRDQVLAGSNLASHAIAALTSVIIEAAAVFIAVPLVSALAGLLRRALRRSLHRFGSPGGSLRDQCLAGSALASHAIAG